MLANPIKYLKKVLTSGGAAATTSGVVGEIRNEVIADGIREHGATLWKKMFDTVKPGGEKAYNAITLSWFGCISDNSERAFATIVSLWTDYYVNHNFLAPHHAQKRMNDTLKFLNDQGSKNFARYREKLAKDPDEERRVMTFGELVNTADDDERQMRFDMIVPPGNTPVETVRKEINAFAVDKVWPLIQRTHEKGKELRDNIDTVARVDSAENAVASAKSLRNHPGRSKACRVMVLLVIFTAILICIVIPFGIYLIGV
jgi:hypothetical protein